MLRAMSILSIAWRNLMHRKLQTLITVLIISLGIAMTLSVIMLTNGIKEGIAEASKPYGMLVGSKGSANQLVFNTIYLMDTPLANLPLSYVEHLRKDERVAQIVPFGLGDNYRGHRIVGTTEQFFELRSPSADESYFQLQEGRMFAEPFEAVIGQRAARATGLSIGDTFTSGHGVVEAIEEDHDHAAYPYTVVGIMKETGTPADMGIYVPIASYWISHQQMEWEDDWFDPSHAGSRAEDEIDNLEAEHQEGSVDAHAMEDGYSRETEHEAGAGVTALLVQPESYMQLMQLYAEINNSQIAQAVFPGQVLAEMFDMLGSGEQVWSYISAMILFMTVLTILLFMYQSTVEKRRHLAIMRVIGAGRANIFAIVIMEAAWIAALGAAAGVMLSFLLTYTTAWYISQYSTLSVLLTFTREYAVLVAVIWAVGSAAAGLPAIIAYRTEIAKHLQLN